MKKLSIFISFMLFAVIGHSQTIKSYLISSGGRSSTQAQGGMHASAGEPMNTEISNGEITIAQGFLQVTLIENLLPAEDINREKMNVYPNPTNAQLTLTLSELNGDYKYHLVDIVGKVIKGGEIQSENQNIDLQNILAGTYILNVTKNEELIQSLKIVKK